MLWPSLGSKVMNLDAAGRPPFRASGYGCPRTGSGASIQPLDTADNLECGGSRKIDLRLWAQFPGRRGLLGCCSVGHVGDDIGISLAQRKVEGFDRPTQALDQCRGPLLWVRLSRDMMMLS